METAAVSAQAQQRRQRLKELLITQLAKQFGALSDPKVRAIITAEAERALANGKVAAEDIRQLEANIRRTINFTTSGNLSGPKAPADTSLGSATAERLNWQSLYEYKLIQGDQAERKRLQREKDARELLKSQLRHQIAEQEAARRKAEAQALEYQEEERKQHERRLAEDREKAAQHAALVERDRAQNREHMRLAAKKREEEAELRRLEDERTLAAIRQEEELAKREKARQAVEKAKRLEFAKLADERSARLKAEAKARETAEQQRLDAVWKEILDEQERKREEGLKRMFEKQVVRAEAYGKSAGAEMAERARKDEMNMLRWQAIYAQQQEERCDAAAMPALQPRDSSACGVRLALTACLPRPLRAACCRAPAASAANGATNSGSRTRSRRFCARSSSRWPLRSSARRRRRRRMPDW